MNKIYLAVLLALAPSVLAAELETETIDDSDLPDWAIEKMAPVHDAVSDWVTYNSRNIDGFFGSDEHMLVENDSFLRLSQEVGWNEPDDLVLKLGCALGLICLPQKKDYVLLLKVIQKSQKVP